MKNRSFFQFLKKMDSLSDEIETKQKHEGISNIISSLQQPFKQVLQSVCEKQIKDVDELLKTLKWQKTI